MSEQHRAVFSRIPSSRRMWMGLVAMGMFFVILFISGAGCATPKKYIEADQIHLEAESSIVLRPTLFGVMISNLNVDHAVYVSSTQQNIRIPLETFYRLKIEGSAVVDSGLQDSVTEKLIKFVQEDAENPNLVKMEPAFVDYPIRINGKKVFVSAIRAKGARQDLIILNSSENPLILERVRNPFHRSNILAEGDWKENVLGYQIMDLMVSGYK